MNDDSAASGKDRKQIAISVLIVSAGLLVSVCIVFISFGGSDSKSGDASEKAFTTLIPLIGTWIGTVLAYYFSGENFQRATDSVARLASQVADERLRSVSAADAMISMDAAVVVRLTAATPDGSNINLKTQVVDLLSDRITRLPVLDAQGKVVFVLHESIIFRFISEKTLAMIQAGQQVDISTLTLKDLLDHDEVRNFVSRTIAFVQKDASLADAKRQMESLRKCQDVFITEDGTSDSRAIGWITNVIISRYAKA